jgi:hypothetical protein
LKPVFEGTLLYNFTKRDTVKIPGKESIEVSRMSVLKYGRTGTSQSFSVREREDSGTNSTYTGL